MEDWMPQEAHFDAVMKRVINVALVSSAAPWCGRIFFLGLSLCVRARWGNRYSHEEVDNSQLLKIDV